VLVLGRRALQSPGKPLLAAAVMFVLPVAGWAVARYRVDQWQFLERMFHYDFIARSASALEGHTGGWWYYANTLQKDQYEWLAVAVLALALFPVPWRQLRDAAADRGSHRYTRVVTGSWLGLTLIVPTLMQTKVAWYLNPFFPLFAVIVARIVVRGLAAGEVHALAARRRALVAGLVLVAAVAEGKLLYYSYARRDLRNTVQGMLLAERQQIAGHQVFKDSWWNRADRFVLEHIVGGEPREAEDNQRFKGQARRGDFFIAAANGQDPELVHIRSNSRHRLCRREK
jgi:4-amino-4-deoxy-L-arabinose transferase-like glycosyltransferase